MMCTASILRLKIQYNGKQLRVGAGISHGIWIPLVWAGWHKTWS